MRREIRIEYIFPNDLEEKGSYGELTEDDFEVLAILEGSDGRSTHIHDRDIDVDINVALAHGFLTLEAYIKAMNDALEGPLITNIVILGKFEDEGDDEDDVEEEDDSDEYFPDDEDDE